MTDTDVLRTVPPSPQALDASVRITTARGWIALALVALVVVAAIVWSVVATIPRQATATAVVAARSALRAVPAGRSGSVVVTVRTGDHVTAGEQIAQLEPLRGGPPRAVPAPVAGRVRDVLVVNGRGVTATDTILELTPDSHRSNDELITYLPESDAARYEAGADVTATLVDPQTGDSSVVPAQVIRVAAAPTPLEAMEASLQSPSVARELDDAADGAAYRVDLRLAAAGERPVEGQVVQLTNTYDRQHPIELLFG